MRFRRTDDTGIQAVLSAIEGVNERLGQIDRNLMRVSSTVAVHENEIESMKETAKDSVNKRWVLVAAFIGIAPSVIAWLAKGFKGS